MKEKQQGEWLTASAAAARARVSREAVGQAIRANRLPAQWAGSAWIVRVEDVDAWKPRRAARARHEEAKDG
jgi:excisionase family DNA binding protein